MYVINKMHKELIKDPIQGMHELKARSPGRVGIVLYMHIWSLYMSMQFWFTSSRACGNKSIVVAVSCSYRLRIMWWLDLDRPAYKKLTITFF
jgi:hypothetical protein